MAIWLCFSFRRARLASYSVTEHLMKNHELPFASISFDSNLPDRDVMEKFSPFQHHRSLPFDLSLLRLFQANMLGHESSALPLEHQISKRHARGSTKYDINGLASNLTPLEKRLQTLFGCRMQKSLQAFLGSLGSQFISAATIFLNKLDQSR